MSRWVSGTAEQLGKWHQQAVVARWPDTPVMTRWLLLAFMILAMLATVLNIQVRHAQYQAWQTFYGTEEALLFSTTDAPYFLRHAGSIKNGETINEHGSIRSFPNLTDKITNLPADTSLRSRPLLSVALAYVTDSADPATLLTYANKAILLTSALTALMIVVCFGAAGYWLEGCVAALGGGLSMAYLARSSIGRIDTDQMNLGFIYLIFGLAVFAGKAGSRGKCLIWCLAAGVTANLFMWWYGKPELVVLAAMALAWLLLCLQRNLITTIGGSAIFLISADVGLFNIFGSSYLKQVIAAGDFIFPNTFQTITEIKRISLQAICDSVTGSIEMAFVCFTGLTLFLVRHPVISISYGPLVAFLLLNFIIGNRAIFYSAPIIWFGGAFLITITARFLADQLTSHLDAGQRHQKGQVAGMIAASLTIVVAWVSSPTDYVPRPSFPKPVLEGLASLRTTVDPERAVVATWWDYGYASMFLNELPTLHDGGSQTTPTTHFVARALLGPGRSQGIGTLKFLSTQGHKGIAASDSLENLETAFREANAAPSPDLYLVVTNQMAGWTGSISKIANWDIEQGRPIQLRGNPDGPEVYYKPMNCRFGGYPRYLNCGGVRIDLERGLIGNQPSLVGWTHTRDGKTLRSRSFDHDADLAIQIVQDGNSITVFMLHRQLYDSTFNRLYYQGVADHPAISLHYDDYPHIRIYRIDGTPGG